ncbi:hypothetical protein diail_7252 [Diaporthe ilicicola]|nr:hypothetical protein diail_7252 [Diaporthe ilicicola]
MAELAPEIRDPEVALGALAGDVLGLESTNSKGLAEIGFFEAFQRQKGWHRASFAAGAPVGMLKGVNMRHESPNRRHNSAARLQGPINLARGSIMIAKTV